MPILVHGTLASRERAPRHWDWRAANLWVAGFLCGVAAGEGGGTHRGFVCRRSCAARATTNVARCADQWRSDGVWWRRLQAVQCQGSFAGNQTLAAMVFQSEAQDKAKSTDLMQKRARVAAQAQGAPRSSLLACSSVFQALARVFHRGGI